MDISDNIRTWLGFWKGVCYSVAGLAFLALLLFFFRTHNGY